MTNLIIIPKEEEYYSPSVNFNADTGICEISGDSAIELPNEFYRPIIEWLEEYTKNKQNKIIFNFRLDYYNNPSTKKLIKTFRILSNHKKAGGSVKINAFYKDDVNKEDFFYDMTDFGFICDVKINLIAFD